MGEAEEQWDVVYCRFLRKEKFAAVTCLFGRSRALLVLPFVRFRHFFLIFIFIKKKREKIIKLC